MTDHDTPALAVPALPLLDKSPEDTHTWACPRCTNTVHFVGVDDRGWGGPDSCQGTCGFNDNDESSPTNYCRCDTVLTQPFRVLEQDGTREGENIDYGLYTGGSYNAEIGTYTRVYCGGCNALLWLDPTLDEETKALILSEARDELAAEAAAAQAGTEPTPTEDEENVAAFRDMMRAPHGRRLIAEALAADLAVDPVWLAFGEGTPPAGLDDPTARAAIVRKVRAALAALDTPEAPKED